MALSPRSRRSEDSPLYHLGGRGLPPSALPPMPAIANFPPAKEPSPWPPAFPVPVADEIPDDGGAVPRAVIRPSGLVQRCASKSRPGRVKLRVLLNR